MIYYDVKPLGELIKAFYEERRGSEYMDEMKAVSLWPQVVGSFIASHTIDVSIKNGVLYVRVDSDALRNELNYTRSSLMKDLNNLVGKAVVQEIVLT